MNVPIKTVWRCYRAIINNKKSRDKNLLTVSILTKNPFKAKNTQLNEDKQRIEELLEEAGGANDEKHPY